MKFAVNYSREAEELLKAGKIKFDLFKCPDNDFDPNLIKSAKALSPIYIHFPLNTISGELAKVNWEWVIQQMEDSHTPYINLHFVVYDSQFPSIPKDSTEKGHKEKVISEVLKIIRSVTDRVGCEQVIIENVVYRKEGHVLRPAIESDVISAIIRESGCGLLLDLAHAQLTAKILGIDVYDYLKGFPIDRLRELHTTGIQHDGKSYRDSMPMTEDDWALITWAIQRIKGGDWPDPWAVAFEYGGIGPKFEWRSDASVLEKQVPILHHLIVES
jgi:uncharacterized protein